MNPKETKILFSLIHSAVCGERISDEEKKIYSPEFLEDLLEMSKDHDLAHLLSLGLKMNCLLDKENKSVEQHIFKAVYRYEQLKYEYDKLCNILENAKIEFMPLKGSVLRKYYPEPWMRTSCDIDILIHEEDLERAKNLLLEENKYKYHVKGSHDISFFSPGGIHIELHYDLVEDDMANSASLVLEDVWNSALKHEKYEYWYEMPDQMFYFYHIAHMAKHFEIGGCGIRPFIDLWILDKTDAENREKRDELLLKGELLKFADSVRKLSKVWFENVDMDLVSSQMESYILRGGVYGSTENCIIVQQQKNGGRLKYILSKIIIPYDVIKFHYPILERHKWLMPIMQIRRWGKLIFCGHLKRTANELIYNKNISNEEAQNVKVFLDSIGL